MCLAMRRRESPAWLTGDPIDPDVSSTSISDTGVVLGPCTSGDRTPTRRVR